ncbi:hypothetical protein BDQ17DRAFT_1424692 [Cyathus striatus]|nr:hypothetical protein BDQ17DRAFT_1424692 [Cyathus striatus]
MSIQADLPKFTMIHTLLYHEKPINVLKLCPDSSKLLSGADDSTFVIWDTSSGVILQAVSLVFHGPVSAAVWMPELEGDLKEYARTPSQNHTICSISFHDDGKQILLSVLKIHELINYQVNPWTPQWSHHLRSRIGHAIISSKKEIHVSNLFNGVNTYSLPPSKPLKTYEHPISRNFLMQLACALDGSLVIVGSDDGSPHVFSRFKSMQSCLPHKSNVLTQIVEAVSVGSRCIIATGSSENNDSKSPYPIKLWDSTSVISTYLDLIYPVRLISHKNTVTPKDPSEKDVVAISKSKSLTYTQDGSLKDASEIQWFNDIDDETPLSQSGSSKSNLKHRKTKRARLASFLDLEAEVATGSEDEDVIYSDDNFINNFMDDKDTNIPSTHLSLTQAIQANHGFIDHLTNKYIEKPSSITPQDWPMFNIPVQEGSEETIVHMLTTQAGPKHINSVFTSAMIPGHVYVEGNSLEDVKSVQLSIAKLSAIGFYSWVWLKEDYRYDLAFVTNVCDCSFQINIVHLPRILYKKAPKKRAAGSSKSKIMPLSPFQYEDMEKKAIKGYIFQNSQYTTDGFIMCRKLDTNDYYQVDTMPTIDELRSFEKCRQIPVDVMELSQHTSLSSTIKIGDQVKIMLEGGRDYLAFVEEIEERNVSLNLVEFLTQIFSQSLELLQKFFKVGDGVRVKSGEHKGRVWIVTTVECNRKIGNETITFVTFPLGEANHLQIHSSELDHCSEVQQSTTFRWPDRKSDSPTNNAASYGSEAYKMQVDPYWHQYRKYAWVRCGPLKGTRGILKSISTSNVAQLEVPEHLMFSKDLLEFPMKDLYIPGYSDKSMNNFFTVQTTRKDTEPALSICSTPCWEHDFGIGSQTPTWNPSSRTPQVDDK